ncbi:DsbA family protein [Candidatus Nitrososphaera sp. FF02]|uniref:DsbA family protein n=1 Tax=Candidatus Nitrososphaera sp. FF02 TaxID=3398226 RepID=UPI0039ECCA43
MVRKNTLIAVIAAGAIMAAGIAVFFATSVPQPTEEEEVQMILQQLQSPTVAAAPALGSESATVTVVEFGDYLCTYCHRFHETTKDQLVADYVDTGKIKFIFKDFPINDHLGGGSTLGAQASYCAADQGRFWQFHDAMYSGWGGERAGWITDENMSIYAQAAGVPDIDQFDSCLASHKYAEEVRENYDLARTIGLRATPSFVIIPADGEPESIIGAQPYQTFQQKIDDALSG